MKRNWHPQPLDGSSCGVSPRHFALCSPLGCLTSSYPKDWNVQFNRPELESRWGAWEPMIYSLGRLAVLVDSSPIGCPGHFLLARGPALLLLQRSTSDPPGSWKLSGRGTATGCTANRCRHRALRAGSDRFPPLSHSLCPVLAGGMDLFVCQPAPPATHVRRRASSATHPFGTEKT